MLAGREKKKLLEQEKEDGPGGGEDVLDNSAGLYIVFRFVVFGYPIQVT